MSIIEFIFTAFIELICLASPDETNKVCDKEIKRRCDKCEKSL